MIDKPPPPSMLSILTNDIKLSIPMLVLGLAVFFMVGLFFQVPAEQQTADFWGFMVFMVFLIVGSVVFIRRQMQAIRDIWNRSFMDTAIIKSVETVKYGRARVREMRYVYEYEGELINKRSIAKRKEYIVGSRIYILVDPENPTEPQIVSDYINVDEAEKKTSV